MSGSPVDILDQLQCRVSFLMTAARYISEEDEPDVWGDSWSGLFYELMDIYSQIRDIRKMLEKSA